MNKYVNIFGINIHNTNLREVLNTLEKRLDEDILYTIATPNTEIAMLAKDNPQLALMINKFDLVVADGIGLIYASKIRKLPLQERVTGFDISMGLLELGNSRNIKLYLLGSKPGVTDIAKSNIEKDYKHIQVVGHRNGYFEIDEESEIINEINSLEPDIIFVGLGFPKQEDFIQRNKDDLKGKIIIGNGGVIDILAGLNKRAPDIFIKLNLEWFYRLLQEPKRLKRQMAIPKFIVKVLTDNDSVKEGEKNE